MDEMTYPSHSQGRLSEDSRPDVRLKAVASMPPSPDVVALHWGTRPVLLLDGAWTPFHGQRERIPLGSVSVFSEAGRV